MHVGLEDACCTVVNTAEAPAVQVQHARPRALIAIVDHPGSPLGHQIAEMLCAFSTGFDGWDAIIR